MGTAAVRHRQRRHHLRRPHHVSRRSHHGPAAARRPPAVGRTPAGRTANPVQGGGLLQHRHAHTFLCTAQHSSRHRAQQAAYRDHRGPRRPPPVCRRPRASTSIRRPIVAPALLSSPPPAASPSGRRGRRGTMQAGHHTRLPAICPTSRYERRLGHHRSSIVAAVGPPTPACPARARSGLAARRAHLPTSLLPSSR